MSPLETLPPATPGASVVVGLECPACGTQNTNDSKFCRHCGHLLRPLPGTSSDVKKAAPVSDEIADDDNSLTSPAEIDARRARQLLDRALLLSERGDLNAALLACRQAIALDHDHFESYALLGPLLERNGDLRGAMTAYERVLEIVPDNALERDSLNRIKARLEKAPAFNFNPNDLFGDDSALPSVADASEPVAAALPQEDLTAIAPEREEHGIEARLPPTSSTLRAEPSVAAVAEATPAEEATEPATGVVAVAPVVFDFDPAPDNATPSLSPLATALDGETVASVGAPMLPSSKVAPASVAPSATVPAATAPPSAPTGTMPKIERRVAQRRQVNIPVSTERRLGGERRASVPVAGAKVVPLLRPARVGSLTPMPVAQPTVAPLDFSFGTAPTVPTPLWAQMLRGSSFYGRTLPLVLVGVLGLGFLSWARSQAVARDTNGATGTATTVTTDPDGTVVQSVPQTTTNASNVGTFGVTPAPNSGSGVPITNATVAPVLPGTSSVAPPAGTRVATNPVRPAGGAQGGGNGAATAGRDNAGTPPFPVPNAPATTPNQNTGGTTTTTGGNSPGGGTPIILPPPQTGNTGGDATPRVRVGSLGTNPLNPSGSPQERIRITQGSLNPRSAPPARSGTVARSAENAASSAAANGNQDRAIGNLTTALNSTGGDQGFLLQQRGMAFMERGDYARAIEDFQASISAYQDQINRGENVASAQAGLRASRAGLNMANSRRQ